MPNVSSALQALATDEVDAVVGDLASSVWSLRQLKLDGLYVSGETPYRYQLAMGVPRDNKMLVGILDKVLADMSPEEISSIQEHWVGNVLDHRTFWSDLLIYGLPGLLLLMIILAVVIRINRRLSSEIARRVDLEQELRSSEYHYRGLVESLSAIAWEARMSDFTYSYVSPHAEDLLGYPQAHWLIPGFWRNIIHPADLTRAQAICDEAVREGRDHTLDYRVITADGRCLWVRDIVSLIEHGHEPVMRGLMIDISETKRTEEALRLSEQKFASVFQQCPDILVIARLSDGCLLEVNEAFEEQIGLKAEDVIGQTATELNIWAFPESVRDCSSACRPVASATWRCPSPQQRSGIHRPDLRRTLRPRHHSSAGGGGARHHSAQGNPTTTANLRREVRQGFSCLTGRLAAVASERWLAAGGQRGLQPHHRIQ
ncbi:PAS domain S-box protein [Pseudomonas parakoreensis]